VASGRDRGGDGLCRGGRTEHAQGTQQPQQRSEERRNTSLRDYRFHKYLPSRWADRATGSLWFGATVLNFTRFRLPRLRKYKFNNLLVHHRVGTRQAECIGVPNGLSRKRFGSYTLNVESHCQILKLVMLSAAKHLGSFFSACETMTGILRFAQNDRPFGVTG